MTDCGDSLLPCHASHQWREYSTVKLAGITQPANELESVSSRYIRLSLEITYPFHPLRDVSFEGVRDETELELLTAVYDLPSTTLKCEASNDIFSQGVFGESSNISDRPATEDDARACHPSTVHAVALDLVELAVYVETLVKWIVGRYVIEPLMEVICQHR